MASRKTTAPSDPGASDGRFLIEIDEWGWGLFVGMSPESTPVEYRFQGGLLYADGIEIAGRVRAPSEYRHRRVRVWISPFGPEIDFSGPDLTDVGGLYEGRAGAVRADIEVTLRLPEGALQPALTCLSSIWKYLHVWTGDGGKDFARVTAFSFSGSIYPNLVEWAGEELGPGQALYGRQERDG